MRSNEDVLHVLKAPPMYGAVTFREIASVITGIDCALAGAALEGFREWLVVRIGNGDYNSIAWTGLVLIEAGLPLGVWNDRRASLSEEHDLVAKAALKRLIEEYYHYLDDRKGGLRRVFVEYQKWLWKQEWYDESSPDYISPP